MALIEGADQIISAARPGDLIIFYDDHTSSEPDHTVCNQEGAILREDRVVFRRGRAGRWRAKLASLSKVASMQHAKLLQMPDNSLRQAIADYFEANPRDSWHVAAGFNAIHHRNFPFIRMGHPFPKRLKHNDANQYEAQWGQFAQVLRPGDTILSRDEDSLLSRLIAAFTHGPWSHEMLYIGGGEVAEATIPVSRRISLQHYKRSSVWLCAYRLIYPPSSDDDSIERKLSNMFDQVLAHRPPKYNFSGAARNGLRAFLGDYNALVPNTRLISGAFQLVSQV